VVSQTTGQRASAPPPPPHVDAATEIQSVVAAYARAIESRDITNVKRAYPGATQSQADGFEEFFATVRSLHVTLAITSLDVKGDGAEAQLAGAWDYVTSSGRNEHQPVNFHASFHRDSGAWKLMAVR
jgi:hypothetical protein